MTKEEIVLGMVRGVRAQIARSPGLSSAPFSDEGWATIEAALVAVSSTAAPDPWVALWADLGRAMQHIERLCQIIDATPPEAFKGWPSKPYERSTEAMLFRSQPHYFPGSTMAQAALSARVPSTIGGAWVKCSERQPDDDGQVWFIFERTPEDELGVSAEYYHFLEGWATDSEVIMWWSERMVPPPMPSVTSDGKAE